MTGSTETRIELWIEEIALTGFAPLDVERFGAGLRMELTRMFENPGLPARLRGGGEPYEVRLGALTADRGLSPEALGGKAARSIFQALVAIGGDGAETA